MSEGNRKPDSRETDPEELAKQLEVELMLQRAAWGRTKASTTNYRALSFAFLFLVVLGALLGFYFFISSDSLQELRAQAATHRQASPTPTATPR